MCNIYNTHELINSIERSLPAISFNDFKHAYNEKNKQANKKLTRLKVIAFVDFFLFHPSGRYHY